jgi:hypothetical protein
LGEPKLVRDLVVAFCCTHSNCCVLRDCLARIGAGQFSHAALGLRLQVCVSSVNSVEVFQR